MTLQIEIDHELSDTPTVGMLACAWSEYLRLGQHHEGTVLRSGFKFQLSAGAYVWSPFVSFRFLISPKFAFYLG